MTDLWLPDYVAGWYDEFHNGLPYDGLDFWNKDKNLIESWSSGFKQDPYGQAVKLVQYVDNNAGELKDKNRRRFNALKIASNVFQMMGFRTPRYNRWMPLREHWQQNGNLLRGKDGYLLPREPLNFPWGWPIEPVAGTAQDYFRGFVRWRPSDHPNYKITVTVLPELRLSLLKTLRIGIVPLVDSINEFNITTSNNNAPTFSMALKSPPEILKAAINALDRCSTEQCDIVLFPELCLTPEIQAAIGQHIRTLAGNYPWLVVAGSALTPVIGSGRHHNRAVVFFGSDGRPVLSHHKLHRYDMNIRQQDGYGLREIFGHEDRFEDIQIAPFEIEILDTCAGRMAILICEDLVRETLVNDLVTKLGLDWLLVPVLDGCQTEHRWTARFGEKYTDHGACVVVGTSLSLVKQHLLTLTPPLPSRGVGLVLIPPLFEMKPQILQSPAHDQPAIFDFETFLTAKYATPPSGIGKVN